MTTETIFDPDVLTKLLDLKVTPRFGGEVTKDSDGWEHYEWDVVVIPKGGREAPVWGPEVRTTYSKGTAHVEWFGAFMGKRPIPKDQVQIARNGTAWRKGGGQGTPLTARPIEPTLVEVVAGVACDSDALEYPFTKWAENYGYDTDSRKAEAIYQRCIETGRDFRDLMRTISLNPSTVKEWADRRIHED